MLCAKCRKNIAESSLRHLGSLCRFCFCALIEKRIRKNVRINRVFKKNDKILVVGDLCCYLVKRIIKNLPVKITRTNRIKKLRGYKAVAPSTLDDEINHFLESIFLNKKIKEAGYIKLLKNITDEEAALFAKFKGIAFKPNRKNKEVQEMLDKLSEKYPGIKFSLLKSSEEMKGILNFNLDKN